MIKYFCDRCGKESKTLTKIQIPVENHNNGSYKAETVLLCPECAEEAQSLFDALTSIRFILFGRFMRKRNEGKADK